MVYLSLPPSPSHYLWYVVHSAYSTVRKLSWSIHAPPSMVWSQHSLPPISLLSYPRPDWQWQCLQYTELNSSVASSTSSPKHSCFSINDARDLVEAGVDVNVNPRKLKAYYRMHALILILCYASKSAPITLVGAGYYDLSDCIRYLWQGCLGREWLPDDTDSFDHDTHIWWCHRLRFTPLILTWCHRQCIGRKAQRIGLMWGRERTRELKEDINHFHINCFFLS